jgi:hypothetical protein
MNDKYARKYDSSFGYRREPIDILTAGAGFNQASKPDASLTFRDEEKVTITTQRVPDRVELSLTLEEAFTLRSILYGVGGCPEGTARGYASSITTRLDRLGIYPEADSHNDSIHFRARSRELIQKAAEAFRIRTTSSSPTLSAA